MMTMHELIRCAELNNGIANVTFDKDVHNFLKEIVIDLSGQIERTVDVWIKSSTLLEDIDNPCFQFIVDQDVIGPNMRSVLYDAYNDGYIYHLHHFHRGWLTDIWPEFEKHYTDEAKGTSSSKNNEDGEYYVASPGTLAEYALRNGCDYMDITTGHIYTTRH